MRNPKKRATLKELMSHPWVTKEHADPVPLYPAELPIIPVDEEIIEQMKEYGFHRHKILESLNAHDHNQFRRHVAKTPRLALRHHFSAPPTSSFSKTSTHTWRIWSPAPPFLCPWRARVPQKTPSTRSTRN